MIFLAWHYKKHGSFSVRSAYKMLVGIKRQREDWLEHRPSNSNSEDIKKSWVKLWHVQVPAKV